MAVYVVDANVFCAYFKSTFGHAITGFTACPRALIDSPVADVVLALDVGSQIEHEWRSVVNAGWFDAWLGTALIDGKVEYFECDACPVLDATLRSHGFPASSKDKWYVRLARSPNRGRLVSEDLDFFDPTKKAALSGATRTKFLQAGSGALRRSLLKLGVDVRAICNWP
jgi:hypothetical protein